jgi:hypothetical protein
LDATPDILDWTHPALQVGDVFSDPTSGITIAPVWVDGTAGVGVTVGSGGGTTCVRKNPTVTVSPAQQQGTSGTALTYALSVTSNDTGCPTPNYKVESSAPSNWTVSTVGGVPAAGLTTVSIAIKVTSPTASTLGTVTISSKIFDVGAPAYSGTARAVYMVVNGPGTLSSFTDDFNRADSSALGNGWTVAAGGYAIQGGAAVGLAALNLVVQASVTGQTDAAHAVFVRPTSASGTKFGVVVRYRDVKNYYVCYRQAGGTSQWRISKVVNGVETLLKGVSVSQAPIAAPFTVSCSASGNGISIGDGSAVTASVTDASLTSGAVGIRTDKSVKVDGFSASAQ